MLTYLVISQRHLNNLGTNTSETLKPCSAAHAAEFFLCILSNRFQHIPVKERPTYGHNIWKLYGVMHKIIHSHIVLQKPTYLSYTC